jgi:hypothetical protein
MLSSTKFLFPPPSIEVTGGRAALDAFLTVRDSFKCSRQSAGIDRSNEFDAIKFVHGQCIFLRIVLFLAKCEGDCVVPVISTNIVGLNKGLPFLNLLVCFVLVSFVHQ